MLKCIPSAERVPTDRGGTGAHRCVWQQQLVSLLFRQSVQHARVALQNAHTQRVVIINHILCRCASNPQPWPPMHASKGAGLLWAKHIFLSSQQREWAHSPGTVLCAALGRHYWQPAQRSVPPMAKQMSAANQSRRAVAYALSNSARTACAHSICLPAKRRARGMRSDKLPAERAEDSMGMSPCGLDTHGHTHLVVCTSMLT